MPTSGLGLDRTIIFALSSHLHPDPHSQGALSAIPRAAMLSMTHPLACLFNVMQVMQSFLLWAARP